MATRQELFTTIGIARQICRLNRHFSGVVFAMGFDGVYNEEENFKDFDAQKEHTRSLCDMMDKKSSYINTVLQEVNNQYLDNGFNDLPITITRINAVSDTQDVKSISSTALPSIENSLTKEDLSSFSGDFKTYKSQCGVEEPDPWVMIELEDNYANITHDVIDAMSYELRGLNSYTGEVQILLSEQLDKLINNRIFTANIYLNKLPDSTDKSLMESMVQYVENNYGKMKSGEIGKHIDSNLPKQIIVRRWWAL